ncbi:hypothetical protein [Sphingomonas xinjiangensis]|uniref:Uncharacterized protein n=1 Tax=Sphingomonas xinjiangensis TaxID=643568 RepID=A0A840YSW9_9SPHN|nr:hypothetical protein [Sphingomonas xinjiangensis]MBB5712801.1 hypothetical protein [Sphingomonas xinjiangensis]
MTEKRLCRECADFPTFRDVATFATPACREVVGKRNGGFRAAISENYLEVIEEMAASYLK